MITAALQTLHQAILLEHPSRRLEILDLGSGTGAWVGDMAVAADIDVNVQGVDLGIPTEFFLEPGPNYSFRSGFDFESDHWPFADGSFDFVRCGLPAGCVSDWPRLLAKIRRILRPGGQVEIVEIEWQPRCDSGQLLERSSAIWQWYEHVHKASQEFGKPLFGTIPDIYQSLEAGEFTITDYRMQRLDGVYNKRLERDAMYNQIARWHYTLLLDPALGHFEALSMRLLTTVGGRTAAWVRDICDEARRELESERARLYHVLHVITARRPFD